MRFDGADTLGHRQTIEQIHNHNFICYEAKQCAKQERENKKKKQNTGEKSSKKADVHTRRVQNKERILCEQK